MYDTHLIDDWVGSPSDKPKIIVIYGPTGSGKTALSLEIARQYGGEIISADSRQIYRELSIGTGKILPHEMCGIPHHGLDLVSVTEAYSAGAFAAYARSRMSDIMERGRLPIICGGTGLYLDMTLTDPSADSWSADPEYRSYLQSYLETHGALVLHALLQSIDPKMATTLHPHSTRHVMGALEYHHATGRLKSDAIEQGTTSEYLYDIFWVTPYLDSPISRADLYARIDTRISRMITDGLLEEHDRVSGEYGSDVPGLLTIGYRECALYRSGIIQTLGELEALIAQKNRNYAKRQITWNKKYPCRMIVSPK